MLLSVDEKSQIQALDRTQPGLPLTKGRARAMTHDYKRRGATSRYAAFDVLEGKIVRRCMQRHRGQELIGLLSAVEREVLAEKVVHVIFDNYATHNLPQGDRVAPASSGRSTSRRPGLPSSPSVASASVFSWASSTSRPVSTASSSITNSTQSPSFGPQI